MANTTFSGPVISTNGFVGDFTGNITGNVTGNVTGGNINTGGQVVATGNVNGGNVIATTTVSAPTHIGTVVCSDNHSLLTYCLASVTPQDVEIGDFILAYDTKSKSNHYVEVINIYRVKIWSEDDS